MEEWDFSDAESFLDEIGKQVTDTCEWAGKKAVEYAKENGTYHNVTGRLRRSNLYAASPDGLILYNSAPYAAEVEARGEEVISGAALYAAELLKEECQK